MKKFYKIDSLTDVDEYYHNSLKALELRKQYVLSGKVVDKRFLLSSVEELKDFFNKHKDYLELNCVFNVLGLIEFRFKTDFNSRVSGKKSSFANKKLTNRLKLLECARGNDNSNQYVHIRDILDAWIKETPYGLIIKKYINWLDFRNWLAHGRYLEFKNLRKYDYETVRELAETIFSLNAFRNE